MTANVTSWTTRRSSRSSRESAAENRASGDFASPWGWDVLGWLAAGMTHEEIIDDYPDLTEDDIRACLAYAADKERHAMIAFSKHEAAV
jgi:hypothetical protein